MPSPPLHSKKKNHQSSGFSFSLVRVSPLPEKFILLSSWVRILHSWNFNGKNSLAASSSATVLYTAEGPSTLQIHRVAWGLCGNCITTWFLPLPNTLELILSPMVFVSTLPSKPPDGITTLVFFLHGTLT